MYIYRFFENGIWFGLAAVGFAILFNVPGRTLPVIWILAALGGLTKLALMYLEFNVILGSFAGATLIGLLSIPSAHLKHAPPLVFAIPAVIPMVPGVFAYKMVLGLIHLSGNPEQAGYAQILSNTVNNGLKVLFILLSLAAGVAIPMLITRRDTIKKQRVFRQR